MNAHVTIQTGLRDGITYLAHSYFTPPFKIANITEDKRSPWLHLMMMNSSPGVLDGDKYIVQVDIAENCCLQLHSQSYQRLFTMKTGASQLMEVNLLKGSSFTYLPHPCVPHDQSIFTNCNTIRLADDCSLIWGEIMTCGRKLNGEIFKFSKYHSITDIFMNDKLIIRENLLMQPGIINPAAMGQLEGFTHQASFIYLHKNSSDNECLDEVNDYLSQQKDILSGVSITGGNAMIVRILGYGAEQLYQQLQAVAFLVQQYQKQKKEQVYAG